MKYIIKSFSVEIPFDIKTIDPMALYYINREDVGWAFNPTGETITAIYPDRKRVGYDRRITNKIW